MLRQKTGPATIAAKRTSASIPSWSCSLTRCSGLPVPAASATLRPKGCQVPAARPARRSRKFASSSGWPSIISASPPSGRCTVCGARSRYFSGTRWVHRSGGTSRCPPDDINLYWRGMCPSRLHVFHQRAGRGAIVETLALAPAPCPEGHAQRAPPARGGQASTVADNDPRSAAKPGLGRRWLALLRAVRQSWRIAGRLSPASTLISSSLGMIWGRSGRESLVILIVLFKLRDSPTAYGVGFLSLAPDRPA